MESERNDDDPEINGLLQKYYADKKRSFVKECPSADALLDYIDGGLAMEERPVIEEHVLFCDDCRASVLYFKVPPLEPLQPPPLFEAFKQRLPGVRPKSESWWKRLRTRVPIAVPTGALALFAALLLAAVVLYPSELSRLAYVDKDAVSGVIRSSMGVPAHSLRYNYGRGMELLAESQLWKLDWVNETKLNDAIRYLEEAKKQAAASHDEAYVVECSFFLGKAYLKKKNFAQARQQLEVFRTPHRESVRFLSQQAEANRILDAIDRLERSRK